MPWWRLWPLSSEGSLVLHTYGDTRHLITASLTTLTFAFDSGTIATCFNVFCLSRSGFKHLALRMQD